MKFKELSPEVALKAIEGHTNLLEPEAKKLDAFYRQFVCLKCKGPVQKEIVLSHAFKDPDTFVPRSCLRCQICRCLFNPHDGMILELGAPAPIPVDIPGPFSR